MPDSLIAEPGLNSSIICLVAQAHARGREVLFEHECGDLLTSLGIRTPDHLFIGVDENPIAAAEVAWDSLWGERVVLKVISHEILHKSDLGGVRVIRKRPGVIAQAIEEMRERLAGFSIQGFLVSEFIDHDPSPGGELLLGVRWTRDFGVVVTLGAGGVATEFLAQNLRPGREIAVISPELTPDRSLRRILEEKAVISLLTRPFRGREPRLPIESLEALIHRLARFGDENVPQPIRELEINPVVVTPHGLYALDAVLHLGHTEEMEPPRPVEKIAKLLNPSTIAVVGVSRKLNPGRIIVRNLLREGFDPSRIRIVHPDCEEIDGVRCVSDLDALAETVDLAVLSVSAEQVPDLMRTIVARRVAHSVIVIPGGLGEREGTEGLEESLRAMIRQSRSEPWGGPVVNGPNSLGIRSVPGKIDTLFLPESKLPPARKPGAGIALVSQSGAFVASRASRLASISPRYLISIGNQIDLTVADYMEYLADDANVEVIAFYVEGFRPMDGWRWLRAARRATEAGKTVLLYRAGRTPEGAKASASHTAAIAGDAVVARELSRGAGVVVAESLEELEDLTRLFWLLRGRQLQGLRMGAVSNAGYETVAFADNAGPFRFVPWSEQTSERIQSLFRESKLDRIMNVANPLDVNPLMSDLPFVETVRAILADPGVDAGVVGCVPLTGSLQTLPKGEGHGEDLDEPGSVVAGLGALWQETVKPWVMVIDSGALYDPMAARLEEAGVPVFRSADRAMKALAIWAGLKREL